MIIICCLHSLKLASAFASTPQQHRTSSITTTTNNNKEVIDVSTIQYNHDILSLANIRYQEWMANNANPPSIYNFRLATNEIYEERCADGAIVFLARMNSSSSSNGREGGEVVGAAELSPIELKDVVINNNQQQQHLIRYVTDVVTSSTSRRLGVGSTLMNYIEQTAYNDMGTRCLLLHVEEGNDMARQFYEKLNYIYVNIDDRKDGDDNDELSDESGAALAKIVIRNDDLVIHIDSNRLAMNAGTSGQLLMMKELSEPAMSGGKGGGERIIEEQEEVVKKGFGKQSTKNLKRAKGGRS
ncbi:hypothetical protein ACHAWC_001892 [Mediolabrus comicus]